MKYLKNANFAIGASLIILILLVMLAGFIFMPHPPNEMNLDKRFAPPSREFPLGTDDFGRDVLSRLIYGSRGAFVIGFFSVAIGLVFGVSLGAAAGYFGGAADIAVSKLVEVKMAFPSVLLALMVISVFGGGTANLIAVLGIMSIPRFARVSRGAYMQAKQLDYVKAAGLRGAGHLRIMLIHILPNITAPIVVAASFSFSNAVLTEAALSYLGLGVMPPDASWGRMLYEAQPYILSNPLSAIAPGIAITLLVLGFNLAGDGINEIARRQVRL